MYGYGHRRCGDRNARGFGFGGRHGGRDPQRGEHREGRGGRRRMFDHGDLRYVLLRLIAEQPRHGYELIKAIEDAFGGTYSPSPGVVYPTLTLLEELGYVEGQVEAEGGRKHYAMTQAGAAFLAENAALADAIFSRIEEARRAYAGGPAPEIRRAMHNLEQALAIRLGRGPLNTAQVQAVTAALDRAAGEVERS